MLQIEVTFRKAKFSRLYRLEKINKNLLAFLISANTILFSRMLVQIAYENKWVWNTTVN